MKIEINKTKMKDRLRLGTAIEITMEYLIANVFVWLFQDEISETPYLQSTGFSIVTIIFIGFIVFRYLGIEAYVNTLEYDFEPTKLSESSKFITKEFNQARLQVVNDVQVGQGWFDSFFDLFSLTIDYGFSNNGYQFTYDFLTEQQAHDLQKKIKVTSGRGIHIK